MRPTFFISDLHLCAERPDITRLFERFMEETAPAAASLYILGDLFEYWIGDDQLDIDPLARNVVAQLAALAAKGTKIFFMHGNRDFLLGDRFARSASFEILSDPTMVSIGSVPVLLMHGDTLCTDDVAYQSFRAQVRSPAWQQAILAKPIAERIALAQSIRSQSDIEKSMKADAIMDVNADVVSGTFRSNGFPVLVHGHTHRPARHEHTVGGHTCVRWVLQDWHNFGGYLGYDNAGWQAMTITA
ncbi:MAG: UDP-2,3-diacylglucosamine diphosphatase [Burkholderiales bacterium]|nr:UDP-2,3-diacylglucosamine diphosphatase [Burkholderiales bacterium]